ncbi:MAG: glycosyltransferase family 4 protein [Puniceicoccales bacterium]|jgi:glycosyltransferase involved in cell wall biosynthesis|nr:glycosyltransferase family 4 protein [Puniceicoccales bacterium]
MSRIIAVTHEFHPFPGGIAVYVREMALAAARLGHSVEVWCPRGTGLDAAGAGAAYSVRHFAAGGTQGWLSRLATARLWRERADDVRGATLWLAEPCALLTGMYAGALGLPVPRRLLLTLHGSEVLTLTRARSPHRRWLFKRLLARADGVSTLSRAVARLLAERTGFPAERVILAPGAARTDLPTAAGDTDADAAAGAGTVRILAVGRLHPRKGQAALLEAAALLPPETRRRCLFTFAGKIVRPNYNARLLELARRAALRVEFTGAVPDAALPALYAAADIFAMTSEPQSASVEGFGLVLLEAAAAGLPALAHDTGGVGEVIADGETGLLVAHTDRPALARALERLVLDAPLRRRLGDAARRRAATFSWDTSASRLFGTP